MCVCVCVCVCKAGRAIKPARLIAIASAQQWRRGPRGRSCDVTNYVTVALSAAAAAATIDFRATHRSFGGVCPFCGENSGVRTAKSPLAGGPE